MKFLNFILLFFLVFNLSQCNAQNNAKVDVEGSNSSSMVIDENVKKLLGESFISIMDCDTVEAYRFAIDKDANIPDSLGLFNSKIEKKIMKVPQIQIDSLNSILLEKNSYVFSDVLPKCVVWDLAFVYKTNNQNVKILFSTICNVVRIYDNDTTYRTMEIKPAHNKIIALGKALFPRSIWENSTIIGDQSTDNYNVRNENKTEVVDNATYHVVNKKDSIKSIAKKYNTTVEEILKLNNFKAETDFKVGDKIIVKK